jgi:hypothetical protein
MDRQKQAQTPPARSQQQERNYGQGIER